MCTENKKNSLKTKLLRRRCGAFSLPEILIALVILTTITLLIMPRLSGKTEKARRSAALMDIERGLSAALDDYEADNGRFPTSQQGLDALLTKPSSEPVPRNWQGPYLKKKSILDPWGYPYQYHSPGQKNPHSYDLWSFGADGKEGGEGPDMDVVNWE